MEHEVSKNLGEKTDKMEVDKPTKKEEKESKKKEGELSEDEINARKILTKLKAEHDARPKVIFQKLNFNYFFDTY